MVPVFYRAVYVGEVEQVLQ